MAEKILVIAEHDGRKIARSTWEAVAAAQHMAGALGGSVAAAILGHEVRALAAELAKAGLSGVALVESPLLAAYTADGYAFALQALIRERAPEYIVLGHTYQTRDFAPKLAAALGTALISDCLGCRFEDGTLIFTRPVLQGKFEADVEPLGSSPWLISFQAGAFQGAAEDRPPCPITDFKVEIPEAAVRTRAGERFREARQTVDLAQAEIIVAAGRGIKSAENLDMVKKLAEALGGEVGASRPVCDSGWLPMDRQIGSSGQTVAPKLYIALGISGAIQHQVGMKRSKTIVAINKDKEAPIFEISAYGVVGDLFEIVPPLTDEIRKMKAE